MGVRIFVLCGATKGCYYPAMTQVVSQPVQTVSGEEEIFVGIMMP